MPTQVRGLPAHVLLVHAVVVVVPLAAVLLVVSALWPRARRWLGGATPLTALAALVLVPITTHAGNWLRDRVADTPLVQRHAQLGAQLLPWAIALFVVACGVWLLHRRQVAAPVPVAPAPEHARVDGAASTQMVVQVVAAVLAVAVGVGTIVQVVRIGESGSRAVWQGSFSEQPRHDGPGR